MSRGGNRGCGPGGGGGGDGPASGRAPRLVSSCRSAVSHLRVWSTSASQGSWLSVQAPKRSSLARWASVARLAAGPGWPCSRRGCCAGESHMRFSPPGLALQHAAGFLDRAHAGSSAAAWGRLVLAQAASGHAAQTRAMPCCAHASGAWGCRCPQRHWRWPRSLCPRRAECLHAAP